MCLSAQGQFGWSSEQSGLEEGGVGMTGAVGSLPPNPFWDSMGSACSPTGKSTGRKQSCEEENQNLLRFLESFCTTKFWQTSKKLHCSVNYSRNSFARGTQRKNWVCHFSLGLLCLFLPLFSLLPVNTHPPKKEISWRQHFAWFCNGNLSCKV